MEGTGSQSYLNEQFNLVEEYNKSKENGEKYENFNDFLEVKYQELSLELTKLRQKRIRNRGGDVLKRCAIVKKLMAIDDLFVTQGYQRPF